MCLDDNVAVSGAWRSVVWAVVDGGRAPALDFFETLPNRTASKVLSIFRRLADQRHVSNGERFRKEGTAGGHAIWAIRHHQVTFLGAFVGGLGFVIAIGLTQRPAGLRNADLSRAAETLRLYLEDLENGD